MITTLTWVPRGAARSIPVRYEIGPEEYAQMKLVINEGNEISTESATNENELSEVALTNDETLLAFDMDKYDDEEELPIDDDDEEHEFELLEQGDMALAMEEDSDEEDAEDNKINPTDALIIVAVTEEDFSHLEVYLLSDDDNLYVHHDIALKDFPLCLAWLDCPPFRSQDNQQLQVGNYVAVGTFDPTIEIWNLDVLDPLEPSASLGGFLKPNTNETSELTEALNEDSVKTSSKKKKKKSKKSKPILLPTSHKEAVMGLSWNHNYRHMLASGSADMTVKVWDVTTQNCLYTYSHHTDKVQSVQWHPVEGWLLATGAFDKKIALIDGRSSSVTSTYAVPADLEALRWDACSPFHLYAALEDGVVVCMDVRNTAAPLFSFQAHNKTVTSLSISSSINGMLATASIDKTVKIWDARQLGSDGTPTLVAYKTMGVGKLFAMEYYMSDPFKLACGGDKSKLGVWETDELDIVREHFQDRNTNANL